MDARVDVGGGGGGGGVVVSAGPKAPEGCSSSSWLGSNAPRLVKTLRRSTQLHRRFFKLICGWATPPLRPLDIKHVMNRTRPSPFFTALPHPCIIVNRNRRTEKPARPGNEVTVAQLTYQQGHHYVHVIGCTCNRPFPWQQRFNC